MRWSRRRRPAETSAVPAGAQELAGQLPDPETLRRHCQGLAMLDAVQCEDPAQRYYSFDTTWGPSEQLASMDDGCGNSWSITFTPAGVWLRGFDHESDMSPYREPFDIDWLAGVPASLRPAAAEPAFTGDDLPLLTVACWWLHARPDGEALNGTSSGRGRWQPVQLRSAVPTDIDDGSRWLSAELDVDADAYCAFAAEYYEVELDPADVAHVLASKPLDSRLLQRLNPRRTSSQLAADIARIGFPSIV